MFGNYNNPYYSYVPPQRIDSQYMQQPQPMQQPMYKSVGLQGKSVDSVDVVKAMDIPLDGSPSYFPLTDGSAIVTKQLQADGTSKTTIYKPVDETTPQQPKYATLDDVNAAIKGIDNSKEIKELKDELKTIKRTLKDLTYVREDD